MSDFLRQHSEAILATLDDSLARYPDLAPLWEARAQLRARVSWGWAEVAADCAMALKLRTAQGEFTTDEHYQHAIERIERAARGATFYERKFERALALAHLDKALEQSPANAELWRERARLWIKLGERWRAESDFERARERDGDGAESYLEQAYHFEQSEQWDAARDAFDIGLMMKVDEGSWASDAAWCRARAEQEKLPVYQRRAWLDWGVERWPDDVPLRLARARQNSARAALADLEQALKIAPHDPTIYRARADFYARESRGTPRWGARYWFELSATDHAHATRLQIAAGEINTRSLPQLGDADADTKMGLHGIPGAKAIRARAHGYYSLALEIAPATLNASAAALLHLTRGHAAQFGFGTMFPDDVGAEMAPWADFTRALICAPDSISARDNLVEAFFWRIREEASDETSHERLEALLKARDLLRDFGLGKEQTNSIMSAVQKRLAEA